MVRRKVSIEAEQKLKAISDSNLTNSEKRNKLIKEYQRSVDDLHKTNPDSPLVKPDYVAKTIQNIKNKNKDPAVAAGGVDLSGFNYAKNQLTAILAEYSNAQKKLDAEQKAGLISQAEYSQRRDGLIGNERDEVTIRGELRGRRLLSGRSTGDMIVMEAGRTVYPNLAGIFLGGDPALPGEDSTTFGSGPFLLHHLYGRPSEVIVFGGPWLDRTRLALRHRDAQSTT